MHWRRRYSMPTMAVVIGALLFAGSSALAAETWVDEVWNMVAFEKASYPSSNFEPYFHRLAKIKDGIVRTDEQIVRVETDLLLKMLQNRDHGITDVAADEIYNFVLSVKPTDQRAASSPDLPDLSFGGERLLSVPDHTINTPYEGGKPCKLEGCDYWLDDVFDPGAS